MSRWVEWHTAYDDPDSALSRRLEVVQRAIAGALDSAPPGPVRIVSMCAGEARDLLGVLRDHPRRGDVTGRLVELDPELARIASASAPDGIEVHCRDAATTSAYAGAVPADLVLACGVFGNIADADIAGTIRTLPSLCAPRATVIWTRHRRAPDATGFVRETFAGAGFEEVAFEAVDDYLFGVGVHRLVADPPPFSRGVEMFRFVGYDALEPGFRCDDCGFVYELAREQIVNRLDGDAARFVARLRSFDDASARRRPAPDVWSPLEYACHVRDVLRVQHERVELIQREENPTLVSMHRDERVVEDRYNHQVPAVVARELLDAARSLAVALDELEPPVWQRTAVYQYPQTRVRDVAWIATHTVHELQHHGHDIGLR